MKDVTWSNNDIYYLVIASLTAWFLLLQWNHGQTLHQVSSFLLQLFYRFAKLLHEQPVSQGKKILYKSSSTSKQVSLEWAHKHSQFQLISTRMPFFRYANNLHNELRWVVRLSLHYCTLGQIKLKDLKALLQTVQFQFCFLLEVHFDWFERHLWMKEGMSILHIYKQTRPRTHLTILCKLKDGLTIAKHHGWNIASCVWHAQPRHQSFYIK